MTLQVQPATPGARGVDLESTHSFQIVTSIVVSAALSAVSPSVRLHGQILAVVWVPLRAVRLLAIRTHMPVLGLLVAHVRQLIAFE
jgi:hypothetical protein